MTLILIWILTAELHGSVLLLAALIIDSALKSVNGARLEALWRAALFGCALTATLAMALPRASFGPLWRVPVASPSIASSTGASAEFASSGKDVGVVPLGATQARVDSVEPGTGISAVATQESRPLRLFDWLIAVWLAGAAFGVARTAAAAWTLRRRLMDASRIVDVELNAAAAELATQAGIAPPTLLRLDDLPSPIAVTGARIVVPEWALHSFDADQLRAMLAHELAHIARRDPQWKLAMSFWRSVFWFLPLAGIAQRRLDEIAEIACDDFAAHATGGGRGLAECLAACAEQRLRGSVLRLAPAMAARRSSLLHRIERLLDGVNMEYTNLRGRSRAFALIALTGAAVCLPAIGVDADSVRTTASSSTESSPSRRGDGHSSVSIISDDGEQTMSVSMSDDDHHFSAKVNGKIEFNADESDVAKLGSGGSATFEEKRAGTKRRLELQERSGVIERHYFVDGSEHPIGEAGEWTKNVIIELARSGIGAEARARRLYQAGGAAGVLDEIDHINTDYVRNIYLTTLMGMSKLKPAELDHAMNIAGKMSSDYERRRALTAIFDAQPLDAAQQISFLRQIKHFDSDYERAEQLIGVLRQLADTPEVRSAWLVEALKVHSDYERRRTLQAMLARKGLDDTQIGSVIEASSTIGSDYEHRELLTSAAQQAHDLDVIAPAYAQSTQHIGSEYERREALLALIHAGRLGSRGASAVLTSAAHIQSTNDLREVLVALARVMPNDAALVDQYRQIAHALPDYEREAAERALRR